MATKQKALEPGSSELADLRGKQPEGGGGTTGSNVDVPRTQGKAKALAQPRLEPSSFFFAKSEQKGLRSGDAQQRCFGLIETRGFLPLVVAADAMLKAANIELVRYERVMGELAAICVVGDISAVRIAVDSGKASAENFGEVMAAAVLSNPAPAVAQTLFDGSTGIQEQDVVSAGQSAIGIVETQGFVTAVVALDAMLKAASVRFRGMENGWAGTLTSIIMGDLSAVRYAVDAGVEAAGRVGQVIASQVLARPQVTQESLLPLSEANLSRLMPPGAGR